MVGRTPDGKQHGGKRKPRLGAGLPLDKFAKAKQSGWDKREARAAARLKATVRAGRLRKLKERLTKQGKLPVPARPTDDGMPAASSDDARVQAGTSTTAVEQRTEQASRDAGARSKAPLGPQEPLRGSEQPSTSGRMVALEEARQSGKGSKQQHKPLSSLQRLAGKVEAQKEAQRAEAAQRRRAIEEAAAAREAAEKRRRQQKKAFMKKTRHGQPLMKSRMEVLLSKLQAQE